MNRSVLKIVVTAAIICAVVLPSFSQSYYLVIGSFSSSEEDVRTITNYLPSVQSDTTYTVENERGRFYVLKTSNEGFARNSAELVQNHFNSKASEQQLIDPAEVYASASGAATSELPSSVSSLPTAPKGRFFKFTIDSYDGRQIKAKLHHVDLARGRDLQSYSSETYVDVMRPQSSEPMTVVLGVFGYKEIDKEVDFYNPSMTDGAYRDENGAWVIPYTLERVERGDVSIMYNVSFVEDAVIMTPPSKTDLDELVLMMNENPNYEIKIHSYCNGKNKRMITGLGANKNYFDVSGSVQLEGSAKQLTRLRAEAIKSYLLDHGISPTRIDYFAWGGADMLIEKSDPESKINDRIEIEILRD